MNGSPAASSEAQWVERPEGRIAYDTVGTGPLVICVPGMGELRSVYRRTVPALAAAGYRAVTIDLRGHGDSDATFSSYDDVAAGGDILALIEHLGGPAVVVGNSMGAGAAAWAAAERPELVTGLVLVGAFVRNPPMNPLLALAFRAAMAGPWAPRVWASYLPKLYPGRRPDDFAEHTDAIVASMRRPGHARAFSRTTRTSHAPVEAPAGRRGHTGAGGDGRPGSRLRRCRRGRPLDRRAAGRRAAAGARCRALPPRRGPGAGQPGDRGVHRPGDLPCLEPGCPAPPW
jgi:pimeloyl-ACP methyl ester carboxylesterase